MLIRLIDKIHLKKTYLGSRRIVDALVAQGHKTGRKRVQRLMRRMGIQAIHPRTEVFEAASAAQGLSIPVAEPGHQSRQPGLGE
jgi:hypothetical protein